MTKYNVVDLMAKLSLLELSTVDYI